MLDVRPEFTVTAAKRTASSSCCGAKLDVAATDFTPAWSCRACSRVCDRVLSGPEEVTVRG